MNLRAWLELGRISNLPTVWSNVVHGLSVAFFIAVVAPIQQAYPEDAPPIDTQNLVNLLNVGFLLLVGMSLIYTGGMVLNDACDASLDAKERPARPIPSGRISRRSAWIAAAVLLMAGWCCTLAYRPQMQLWAGVLVGVVVAYNFLHRVRFAGLVLMPACRGLVIWVSALAINSGVGIDGELPRVYGSVLAIACYTLIVTLIAWGEALPSMGRLSAWVGVLIAGMTLVDAVFLWQTGMVPMAWFSVGCGVAAWAGQRWIKGS